MMIVIVFHAVARSFQSLNEREAGSHRVRESQQKKVILCTPPDAMLAWMSFLEQMYVFPVFLSDMCTGGWEQKGFIVCDLCFASCTHTLV